MHPRLLVVAILSLGQALAGAPKPAPIDTYAIHADGGLIYDPLRREAEKSGQLSKFDNTPTSKVRIENNGVTFEAAVPKSATAYDVVPIRYTLRSTQAAGTPPVHVAATAFEDAVVIADGADATNGGSPGDSTCLLREMLAQNITCPALLTIVDPEAVGMAFQAGLGSTISVAIGAKKSRLYHQPVEIQAHVERFSDGQFHLKGHIAQKVSMGRCAVLAVGGIRIVASEFAGPGHDPEVYRHIGLEPRDAQIVVVKATVGHMDAYRDIMKLNLPTECPGPSPSRLERLDYRHIPRPIHPLDPEMQFS